MRRTHLSLPQGIALVLTLVSGPCTNCGAEDSSGPPPDTSGESLVIVSGDDQTVGPGGAITLAARASHAGGTPTPGASINWTAESGTVSPRYSVTDANGIGTTVWTLPSGLGSYRVFALYHNEVQFRGSVAGCLDPYVIGDDFSTDVAGRWTSSGPGAGPVVGPPTIWSATYLAGSGNPGGYWRFQHVAHPPMGLTVYHRFDVDYDPALPGNEIDHINYTEDQIYLAPYSGSDVRWSLFLEQGGTRFAPSSGVRLFGNAAWAKGLQTNLTPAQFPGANLGPGGGKIRFGIMRETLVSAGGPDTTNHGIDNFRVEVCRK